MEVPQIVIDTNVLVSALRSRRGASHKLLGLIENGIFQINLSVPLVLEYEDAAKRMLGEIALTEQNIDDIIDYLCQIANLRKIYYLWRPYLKDPNDDMVLELAVAARCDVIVTFNQRDFRNIRRFGIRAITPREFLIEIGELS
ncbi:MAG: putative toxin-antitoxin system toxin component, PIN family [Pirellulales bacterium]|nr:putative toxin-antitoxin system toxin component, PIN family [Pirellulales bacterium]